MKGIVGRGIAIFDRLGACLPKTGNESCTCYQGIVWGQSKCCDGQGRCCADCSRGGTACGDCRYNAGMYIYELCHEVKSSANGQQQQGEQFVFRRLDHSVIGANAKDDKDLLLYTPSNYQKLEAMVQKEKANFCVTGDVLTKLANHAVEEATLDKNSFAIDDRAVPCRAQSSCRKSSYIQFGAHYICIRSRHSET